MKNKSGTIGKMSVAFVATIIIFLLLLVFIFASSIIKDYINAKREESLRSEEGLGIKDVDEYMESYNEILTNRDLVIVDGEPINWSVFNLRRGLL